MDFNEILTLEGVRENTYKSYNVRFFWMKIVDPDKFLLSIVIFYHEDCNRWRSDGSRVENNHSLI